MEADCTCDSYVYRQRQKQLQEPATNHSCHNLDITYSNDNKLCWSSAVIMLQEARTQDWLRASCGRLLQHFAHCTGGTDANFCLARQVDTSKYFVKNILLIFFLKPKGHSIWHPEGWLQPPIDTHTNTDFTDCKAQLSHHTMYSTRYSSAQHPRGPRHEPPQQFALPQRTMLTMKDVTKGQQTLLH